MIITEKNGAIVTIRKIVKSKKIDKILCEFNLATSSYIQFDQAYKTEIYGQQKGIIAIALIPNEGYTQTVQPLLNYYANRDMPIDKVKPNQNLLENFALACSELENYEKLNLSLKFLEENFKFLSTEQWSVRSRVQEFLRRQLVEEHKDLIGVLQIAYEYYQNDYYCHERNPYSFEVFRKEIFSHVGNNWTRQDIETFIRIAYFQGATNLCSLSRIAEYIHWCKKMQIKIPSGNFITNYRKILSEYREWEDKTNIETFQKSQSKIKFANYETEQFTIIIPTTRKELAKYGAQLSNCLNGHEWDNWLKTGRRQVIVIFDKKENKAVAAADFVLDKKQVVQFYGYRNSQPSDEICDYFGKIILPQVQE